MPSMTGFDLEVTGYVDAPAARARPPPTTASCAVTRIAHPHRAATGRRVGIVRVALQRRRSATACSPARCARSRKPASPTRDILVVDGARRARDAARAAAARADRRLRRAGRAGRGDPRRDLPLRDRRQRVGGAASPSVQLEFGIPIGNGILTTETDEQALDALRHQGLRGGAGGARAREPARCHRRHRLTRAPRAARASSCCRASTSASSSGNAADAIRAQLRRGARASPTPTSAYFDELWRGRHRRVRRAARARSRRISTARRRSSRRSSARSS